MKTLIEVEALLAHLNHPDWFIFDCRFSLADETQGPRLFEQSHIPGAQYANLNRDLSAPAVPGETGRHPLPRRDDFVSTVQTWGVTPNAQIIAYDDMGGAFAARLWWMFRWLGHERVAVLNGGFAAWTERRCPVTDRTTSYPESNYRPGEPLTRTVSADDLENTDATIIDARDVARYRGENETIDRVAGHIPGAVSLPFADNLDESQRFKPVDELEKRFTAAGVTTKESSICYCGSGVTATHNILALVHCGYPEPALYPGSWSEWITDPDRPIELPDRS